jgi:hypothetical protein
MGSDEACPSGSGDEASPNGAGKEEELHEVDFDWFWHARREDYQEND